MRKPEKIILAVLFLILVVVTSAIFVSNVLKMKSYRLMKHNQRGIEKQDTPDAFRAK